MATHAITNAEAEALIQEQLGPEIVQDAPSKSVFLSMARRLSDMTSDKTSMPVMDLLPMAYWVNGDVAFKKATRMAWDGVKIKACELAVIVPIAEAVLDDANYDIMAEVLPRVNEAIGWAVDSAAFFGLNKPDGFPADIITRARQAGNNVATTAATNYYDAIMGENGVIAKVEATGKMVTGAVSGMPMRAKLRGIKDDAGHPIFVTDMKGATPYAIDGAPMFFPTNDSFDNSIAQLIVGDFAAAVYAIRKDITVKILDQAVIQDPSDGSIIYNLAQNDMIAIRVVFRMGWALPNPATRMNGDRVNVPFAYLEPNSPMTDYSLTFTVSDSGNSPVSGAYIEINGARLKTNASGQAVFHLRNGAYDYTVKTATGTAHGTKTINGSNTTESVTLT